MLFGTYVITIAIVLVDAIVALFPSFFAANALGICW